MITEKMFACGRKVGKLPTLTEIAYAYANTAQNSGMRKLLADWCAWKTELGWFESTGVRTFMLQQSEFAADVIGSLAGRINKGIYSSNPFDDQMPEKYKDKESTPKG